MIEQILDKMSQLKVLIIGDVMLDRYLIGSVDRISPEAPVPVVNHRETINRPGGAANVAANITALGAKAILCSVVGEDEAAQTLLELLPQQNRGIISSSSRPTTQKSRIMAGKQQLLRLDQEKTNDLSDIEQKRLLGVILELLDSEKIDLVLFQDYNKGVLTPKLIRSVMLEALKREILTAVDPKERYFFEYKRVDLFKPNLREVSRALGQNVEANLDALRQASKDLRQRLKHRHSLITLSEKGLFIDNTESSELLPTQSRAIADVCGAGDTVFAIAALGMAIGLDLRMIGLLSNLAAGQVCEYAGVVPVSRDLLIRDYLQLADK
ncbi:MAG: bifunctional ADP-heptose synthase [Bacteroidota bacterium]